MAAIPKPTNSLIGDDEESSVYIHDPDGRDECPKKLEHEQSNKLKEGETSLEKTGVSLKEDEASLIKDEAHKAPSVQEKQPSERKGFHATMFKKCEEYKHKECPREEDPPPIHFNDLDTLVLGGGGVYGVSYLGVLESLYRVKGWDTITRGRHVNTICGVSVGALLGLFLACGFKTFEDIHQLLYNLMHSSLAVLDPFQIGKSWGLNNGTRIKEFVRLYLDERVGASVRSFRELRQATGVALHVHATDLQRCAPYLFSPEHTPEADVVEAVYASMAVPMFFAPSKAFGTVLVDGGLLSNVPIVPDDKREKALLLRACCSPEGDVQDIPSFVSQVVEAGLRARTIQEWDRLPTVLRQRTIHINCSGVSAFRFDLDDIDKKKLLLKGLEAADAFYETNTVLACSRFRSVATQTD